MDDRFETFTMAVLRLNKLVQRIKLLEMGDYGLKAIHVMCIYYAANGPVTAGELSRLACEDKAAVSRALRLLRQRGYIVREEAGYNAAITLTEEGRRLGEYITVRAQAAVEAAAGDLTAEQHEIFNAVLCSVEKNLEEYCKNLSAERSNTGARKKKGE